MRQGDTTFLGVKDEYCKKIAFPNQCVVKYNLSNIPVGFFGQLADDSRIHQEE